MEKNIQNSIHKGAQVLKLISDKTDWHERTIIRDMK